jgi:hypothetical protein
MFGMQKQSLLMRFIWNIKQHTTDHKYAKPHYILLDLEINTLKKATLLNSRQFALATFLPKQ